MHSLTLCKTHLKPWHMQVTVHRGLLPHLYNQQAGKVLPATPERLHPSLGRGRWGDLPNPLFFLGGPDTIWSYLLTSSGGQLSHPSLCLYKCTHHQVPMQSRPVLAPHGDLLGTPRRDRERERASVSGTPTTETHLPLAPSLGECPCGCHFLKNDSPVEG